jgi:hypothetical protein
MPGSDASTHGQDIPSDQPQLVSGDSMSGPSTRPVRHMCACVLVGATACLCTQAQEKGSKKQKRKKSRKHVLTLAPRRRGSGPKRQRVPVSASSAAGSSSSSSAMVVVTDDDTNADNADNEDDDGKDACIICFDKSPILLKLTTTCAHGTCVGCAGGFIRNLLDRQTHHCDYCSEPRPVIDTKFVEAALRFGSKGVDPKLVSVYTRRLVSVSRTCVCVFTRCFLHVLHVQVLSASSLSMDQVAECPRCHLFSERGDTPRSQCPTCHTWFCADCSILWEPNHIDPATFLSITCDAVQSARHHAHEETASTDFLRLNSKPCPGCHTPTVHYRGHQCHHIRHCPNRSCDTEFCYVCVRAYVPTAEGGRERHPDCVRDRCPMYCQPGGRGCNCAICPDCQPGRPCNPTEAGSKALDACTGCPACLLPPPPPADVSMPGAQAVVPMAAHLPSGAAPLSHLQRAMAAIMERRAAEDASLAVDARLGMPVSVSRWLDFSVSARLCVYCLLLVLCAIQYTHAYAHTHARSATTCPSSGSTQPCPSESWLAMRRPPSLVISPSMCLT